MNVKLESLRVFATVAQCGSLTQAAQRLGRTPSALSMTLKALEREIGGALFVGGPRGGLSDLGRFAWRVASDQVQAHDRALESIAAFARHDGGLFTIGCVPCRATLALPDVLRGFAAERPDIGFEVVADNTLAIAQRVADRSLDIRIASNPPSSLGLSFEAVFSEPFHAWCREDSSLARLGRPIAWRDLRTHRLLRHELSESLSSETLRTLVIRSRLVVQDSLCALAMAAAGDGIAILPIPPAMPALRGLVRLPLADSRALRRIGVLRNRRAQPKPGIAVLAKLLVQRMAARRAAA